VLRERNAPQAGDEKVWSTRRDAARSLGAQVVWRTGATTRLAEENATGRSSAGLPHRPVATCA